MPKTASAEGPAPEVFTPDALYSAEGPHGPVLCKDLDGEDAVKHAASAAARELIDPCADWMSEGKGVEAFRADVN